MRARIPSAIDRAVGPVGTSATMLLVCQCKALCDVSSDGELLDRLLRGGCCCRNGTALAWPKVVEAHHKQQERALQNEVDEWRSTHAVQPGGQALQTHAGQKYPTRTSPRSPLLPATGTPAPALKRSILLPTLEPRCSTDRTKPRSSSALRPALRRVSINVPGAQKPDARTRRPRSLGVATLGLSSVVKRGRC